MFPKTARVLVVDDMMTMRKIISKCLKNLEIASITEADDGATAWPVIEQAIGNGVPFDLIISDWNMPKVKGIELLRKVRENPGSKDIPFIFVTAESEVSQVQEGIKAGANAYILKPFTPQDLSEKLAAVYKKFAKSA